jgi:hypothetical protein
MLRTLPRRCIPRASRFPATRPIAALAVPKLARGLATPAKAVPPSPIDAFANGANSYYIEE